MSNMYIGQLPITRLVNDLIKANESRAQQPFIIVVTHRPLLCSDGSELQQHLPNSTLFKTVYPLFVKYQSKELGGAFDNDKWINPQPLPSYCHSGSNTSTSSL
ncbi:unnamed protein product [Adineta ricciae]|uniref:Uncharacterized protein n=1 Tax=Adineta ricciae TaxID=249248 RepID=A0A813VPU7_ADIRI|nr:unnamed protein product [Adineta ricciae]